LAGFDDLGHKGCGFHFIKVWEYHVHPLAAQIPILLMHNSPQCSKAKTPKFMRDINQRNSHQVFRELDQIELRMIGQMKLAAVLLPIRFNFRGKRNAIIG
jgi:hypothetical protein